MVAQVRFNSSMKIGGVRYLRGDSLPDGKLTEEEIAFYKRRGILDDSVVKPKPVLPMVIEKVVPPPVVEVPRVKKPSRIVEPIKSTDADAATRLAEQQARAAAALGAGESSGK